MAWQGNLRIDYRLRDGRSVAHDRHDGPLRVLRPLYPEGDAVCHHVLIHPPGGLVGGDRLEIELNLGEGAHALITTPAANRFYRSSGPAATQSVRARLADGARLEWLPLETLAYPDCRAGSSFELDLHDGAEAIVWDLVALGLPASGAEFDRGLYESSLRIRGRALDAGIIDAADRRLLEAGCGLAGRSVFGAVWLALSSAARAGGELQAVREASLEAARDAIAGFESGAITGPAGAERLLAGATAPRDDLIVQRVLADRVEPAQALLAETWRRWRPIAFGREGIAPRVWRT